MPVWGADPDDDLPEWYLTDQDDGQSGRPRRAGWMYNRDLMDVVNHFAYHPGMTMSQVCGEKEKGIVAGWAARKVRGGYTTDQIKQGIDRFYQSWAKDYDNPAYALVSKELEDRLFEAEWRSFSDPVLEWAVAGMPDDGPFDDSRSIRSLLLLRCSESKLRYPDVVLSIVGAQVPIRRKDDLLSSLEYIIQWNLGKKSSMAELCFSQKMLKNFDLPTELTSNKMGGLRPEQPSFGRAIEMMVNSKEYRERAD